MSDPQDIELHGPDGEVAHFGADDARFMMEHGWSRPGDPKDRAQGFVGGVKAGLEGLARGVTLGGSDIAEAKLGIAAPEDILARREAHPYTSIGTAAVGAVAPATAAVLGGTALGAGSVAAFIGGNVLAGALGAAGEHGAVDVLQNKPFFSEALAWDALKGGAWSALFSILGAGAGMRFGRGAAALEKGVEEAAPKAVAELAGKKQLLKLADRPEMMRDIGERLLNEGATSGRAGEAIVANDEALSKLGQAIGEKLENTAAPVAADTVSELTSQLRELAAPTEMQVKPQRWQGELRKLADKVEQVAGVNGEELTSQQLHGVRRELDASIESMVRTKGVPPPLAKARALVNGALNDVMGEDFAKLNSEFGIRKEYAKLLDTARVAELKGATKVSLGDFAKKALVPIGLAATGHPVAAAGAAAQAVAGASSYLKPVQQAIGKIGATATMQTIAAANNKELQAGLKTLLTGTSQGAARLVVSTKDYDRLTSEVKAASENPTGTAAAMSKAIGSDVANHYPDIADGAGMVSSQALRVLAQGIPQPPPSVQGALLGRDWTPTQADKENWLEAYRAVVDPHSVLQHPTQIGMSILKQVYPATAAHITTQLLTELQGKKLDYQSQLRLSKILGTEVSSLTSPALVAGAQKVLAAPPPEEGQKGSARTKGATRAKNRKMDFKHTVESEATQTDRFLERH